jgi:hypothetical protein
MTRYSLTLHILIMSAMAALLIAPPSALACSKKSDIYVASGLTISTPTPFDPFSAIGIRRGGTFIIQNVSNSKCKNVSLAFSDLTSPARLLAANGTFDSMDFILTSPGGNMQLINDSTGLMIGEIPANSTVSVNIDFVIPAAASAIAPGIYSDDDIKLTLSALSIGVLDDTHYLAVSTQVETLLDINIGGASYLPGSISAYQMSFNNPTTKDESRTVNVTIRSNVDHRIRIISANHGVMIGPLPNTNYRVIYSAGFNGMKINLNNETIIPLGSRTGINGASYPFQATITDASLARVGEYQDIITLTVIADL